jgi:hypothetical protein
MLAVPCGTIHPEHPIGGTAGDKQEVGIDGERAARVWGDIGENRSQGEPVGWDAQAHVDH